MRRFKRIDFVVPPSFIELPCFMSLFFFHTLFSGLSWGVQNDLWHEMD